MRRFGLRRQRRVYFSSGSHVMLTQAVRLPEDCGRRATKRTGELASILPDRPRYTRCASSEWIDNHIERESGGSLAIGCCNDRNLPWSFHVTYPSASEAPVRCATTAARAHCLRPEIFRRATSSTMETMAGRPRACFLERRRIRCEKTSQKRARPDGGNPRRRQLATAVPENCSGRSSLTGIITSAGMLRRPAAMRIASAFGAS